MAIELSLEQEQRLQAILSRGTFRSVNEVLDAALEAVEKFSAYGFEGTTEELDELLQEGIDSGSTGFEDAWARIVETTDRMALEYGSQKR